jgi:hypothetical protein
VRSVVRFFLEAVCLTIGMGAILYFAFHQILYFESLCAALLSVLLSRALTYLVGGRR